MSGLPAHGAARGSERYDRPAMAWIDAAEWQRRQWAREDAVFARQANQGELCTPMVIGDGLGKDLQSQVTGRWHDSKSTLRREYKQHGMVEVGTEKPKGRFWHGDRPQRDAARDKANEVAIHKAFNRMGMPPV